MLKIGSLELKNCLLTAPMAGITGRCYRDILHAQGAGLVYGEMVSAQALCYANRKTFELLDLAGEAAPRAVQLLGSDPAQMAEAAATAVSLGADIIDINMGCPVPKVVRNHEGCYLMREPQRAVAIVRRLKASVTVPVTAKIRLGIQGAEDSALPLALLLEEAGLDAITVHGRSREQLYSGRADWGKIAAVKAALQIPVIANGDIDSPAAALAMLAETGCDGIMVGRGMMGNPWLIGDIVAVLAGREAAGKPPRAEIVAQALAHLRAQIARSQEYARRRGLPAALAQQEGELAAVRSLRSHFSWYIKGMRDAAAMRNIINQLETYAEIEAACNQWLQAGREEV